MDDFQKLVYTRLQSLPKDFVISAGDFGEVTKKEALEHVKKNDEVGQFFINIDREYFDMLKNGGPYASINQ